MADSFFLIAVATAAGTAILWFSCARLEEASHALAQHYRVPDVVKGSVLTAVSSSFPELVTAVLAVLAHHDFELGLSAIVGSAIYNILVIPAAVVLVQRKPLESDREVVYREAQFYLVSVATLLLVICMGVIYGGVSESGPGSIVYGRLNRWMVTIPLLLYGLYLFIQWEEARDAKQALPAVTGIKPWKEWLVLLVSTSLIVAGVELVLRAALAMGSRLDTPTFFWGMTIVAAATSIPDMLISIKAALLHRYSSSMSNVLGSNVFDLLVAVPVGVLAAGVVTVNFTQVVPMMVFLMVATVVVLMFMRHDMELTRGESVIMLCLYVTFGVWMATEALGVTSVLGLPRG